MSVVLENQEVRVKGTVQGVGFRPTVYRLALECRLNGVVSNDTDGVLIHLSGCQTDIRQFLQRLQDEPPPLAKIDSIQTRIVDAAWNYRGFTIGRSGHTDGITEIAADAATCPACLAEVQDPAQRRYLYPFTNCTHCGPRLSIIRGIPYDRKNTTMDAFALCQQCAAEYGNPLDRRFHAQPVACHQCGPEILIHGDHPVPAEGLAGRQELARQKLQRIYQALQDGKIVALKGLGGFHLCCDASNHQTVELLRERKHRYAKPFALMCHDLNLIRQYCPLSDAEQVALTSVAAPIVLLEIRSQAAAGAAALSTAIAPGTHLLGFMLPYTPLHSLICREFGKPLVMTSGNLSGEPQIIDNQEAIDKLAGIADLIVYHNRVIANRIDDSVVRCVGGRIRVLRRARGYAPRSIALPAGFQDADRILAYGAELKSTFCLVKQGMAILSQHQGDLEDITTFDDYEHNLALYQTLFEFAPQVLAYDKHPEYISSKRARRDAAAGEMTAVEIQHHHAHIASAMAENRLPLLQPKVLGIALDGLGFGDDDTLWGGEFLLADYHSCQRVARLAPVAMPGGAQAITQPWRNTWAQIVNSMGWASFLANYPDLDLTVFLKQQPVATLQAMLNARLNCPLASSAGRLFDAVAGALNLSLLRVQFEGQAAIELEMLADQNAILNRKVSQPYPFLLETGVDAGNGQTLAQLNPASIWPPLLHDLQQGESKELVASRFHAGLIDAMLAMVEHLAAQFSFDTVVLSGGCLQNAILLEAMEQALQQRQFNCISHALVPANDGGIALGQAVIAAARSMTNATPAAQINPASLTHNRKIEDKICV